MGLEREILADFQAESSGLMDELEEVVEALEEHEEGFPTEQLKEFSQKIDRIMGAAKTLLQLAPGHAGISFVANVSEACKTMGYQAAALQRANLVPIFAGFWADTVETLREVLAALGSEEQTAKVVAARSAVLQRRLAWLAEKVAPGNEEEKAKVVALLKNL